MRTKYILLILVSALFISLSACEKSNEKSNLWVEHASVEIGSPFYPNSDDLFFHVQINESGEEPGQEYKVRFVIQDSKIQDLIGTDKIEFDEVVETTDGETGNVFHDSREIQTEFTAKEIKKAVKRNKAVTVEVYDEDQVIIEKVVKTFSDNRVDR